MAPQKRRKKPKPPLIAEAERILSDARTNLRTLAEDAGLSAEALRTSLSRPEQHATSKHAENFAALAVALRERAAEMRQLATEMRKLAVEVGKEAREVD